MEKKTEAMIPGLSEGKLVGMAGNSIYRRALDYYQRGTVVEAIQFASKLTALVDGSQYEPYQVHIKWDHAGIKKCYCDCPYDGDYCKHIIAVLLLCLHSPASVQKIASLQDNLQKLSKEQLCSLIEMMTGDDIASHRKVLISIDALTDRPSVVTENQQSNQQQTWVDPERYRKEAYHILYGLHRVPSSHIYRHEQRIFEQLGEIIDKAHVFIDKNDGDNALLILQALTEAYLAERTMFDDSDDESDSFFYDLDMAWAKAILTANLSASETTKLLQQLDAWQAEIKDYEVELPFATAELALQQGWHDPELKRILQGEPAEEDDDKEIGYNTAESGLTRLRLDVLEQQKRYAEYIHLAKHKGLPMQVVHMLIQQKQFADAIAFARAKLALSEDALTVAMELRDHHYVEEALSIAELGLHLRGNRVRLGEWLHNLAETIGNHALARQALLAAFGDEISEERYQRILQLTPDAEIEATKANLLARVREKGNFSSVYERVHIFLKEGLFDEAIDTVKKSYDEEAIKLVMKSVMHHNPEWIIQQAHKRAMNIIDQAQASHYDEAVSWLTFVKQAYEAMEKTKEWQSHLQKIKQKHKAKYKLMGLLRAEFGE
jgi:uncharacterized Zn finger protein